MQKGKKIVGSFHFWYPTKLGIIVFDCLFSSSKKANAVGSIQMQLLFVGFSCQYLSFISLNSMKAFECCIDS